MQKIKKSVDGKKQSAVFDVNFADRFELPLDATSEQNNMHHFVAFNFETLEMFNFRIEKRGGGLPDVVWLLYRDRMGFVFVEEARNLSADCTAVVKVEVVSGGSLIRFSYNGLVHAAIKRNRGYVADPNAKPIPIVLKGEFSAISEPFELSCHISSESVARALCDEPDEAIEEFMGLNLTHYAQSGKVSGSITIGNKDVVFKDYLCVRDRSFGNRDWSRYGRVVRSVAVLNNGDMCYIAQEKHSLIKELSRGFLSENKKCVSLLSTTPMSELPIIGTVPNNLIHNAKFTDGSKKIVEGKLDFLVSYNLSDKFTLHEGICDFTVNGIKAKGFADFGFSADKRRWR